ncbi:hypothetical protein LZ30DRAFT_685325 [Colletotrichum cereale]|nr:hypothetical protein LZ30DRAFT_685325 [Colletotrichum cereale]
MLRVEEWETRLVKKTKHESLLTLRWMASGNASNSCFVISAPKDPVDGDAGGGGTMVADPAEDSVSRMPCIVVVLMLLVDVVVEWADGTIVIVVVVVVLVVVLVAALLLPLLPLLPFFSWLLVILNGQVDGFAVRAAVRLGVVPDSELFRGTLERVWWLLDDLGRRLRKLSVMVVGAIAAVVAVAGAGAGVGAGAVAAVTAVAARPPVNDEEEEEEELAG